MGSFDATCALSGIGIGTGTRVLLIPAVESPKGARASWEPIAAPVSGAYEDCGVVTVDWPTPLPTALLQVLPPMTQDPWDYLQSPDSAVTYQGRPVAFVLVREDAYDALVPWATYDAALLTKAQAGGSALLALTLDLQGVAGGLIATDVEAGVTTMRHVIKLISLLCYLNGSPRRGFRPPVALAGSQTAQEDVEEQALEFLALSALADRQVVVDQMIEGDPTWTPHDNRVYTDGQRLLASGRWPHKVPIHLMQKPGIPVNHADAQPWRDAQGILWCYHPETGERLPDVEDPAVQGWMRVAIEAAWHGQPVAILPGDAHRVVIGTQWVFRGPRASAALLAALEGSPRELAEVGYPHLHAAIHDEVVVDPHNPEAVAAFNALMDRRTPPAMPITSQPKSTPATRWWSQDS